MICASKDFDIFYLDARISIEVIKQLEPHIAEGYATVFSIIMFRQSQ
jgi:hypothetical protein